MTAGADTDRDADLDPLEMAQAWARRVGQISDYWADRRRADPGMGRIEAEIAGAGRQQFEAAQMAAFMAEVSLAADVRRIADMLTVVPAEQWVPAAAEEYLDDGDDERDVDEDARDAYREPGQ